MTSGIGKLCRAGALLAATWAPCALAQDGGHTVPGAWRVDTARAHLSDAAASFSASPGLDGPFRDMDVTLQTLQGESVTEMWRSTHSGAVERIRLSRGGEWLRADGAPVPLVPRDAAMLSDDRVSLSYARGWPSRRYNPDSGLQMEFIPHAGFGVDNDGGTAEAGAMIRVGSALNRLAPDGNDAFDDDQARWYVFAAGSRRAVGYNFARTRDGDFVRSGVSHDSGAFIGDAQVGVAWRRGDMQTSFGYVYRKHKVRELVGRDFERERSEGVLAFQLSIRPDW